MSRLDQEMAEVVADQQRSRRTGLHWCDPDDLSQEAWVAVLNARRRYKAELAPSGGIKPLARLAVRTQTTRWIIRTGSPVSGAKRWAHDRELVGFRRAALEDAPIESCELPHATIERWRTLVTVRVREVLGEEEPAIDEVFDALEKGKKLSMAALQALAKLAQDPALRELWEARVR